MTTRSARGIVRSRASSDGYSTVLMYQGCEGRMYLAKRAIHEGGEVRVGFVVVVRRFVGFVVLRTSHTVSASEIAALHLRPFFFCRTLEGTRVAHALTCADIKNSRHGSSHATCTEIIERRPNPRRAMFSNSATICAMLQIRRSGIPEGFGRFAPWDFARFLDHSRAYFSK